MTQLQLEADEDEPEKSILTKTLGRLEAVATASGSAALVAAAQELAQHVLSTAGLS